jgi:glycosyltransferase involved in cell wall biosynthesis
MESETFLSLIVPVYNVAPYVEQCIRSLYQQDIPVEDYEVIVVDDCSTDNSKDIVVGLQQEFPTLRLIALPENVKLGSSRNIGLQHSVGKYIWFIDSDDYIQHNILKALVQELNNHQPEILHFDYQVVNDDGSTIPYHTHYTLETCSGAEFYFDTNELWWQKGVEAWRRICKKSFLTENSLDFAEKVMFEDSDYSIKMFALAQKVKHLDIAPYFYRNNSSSITNRPVSPVHLKYWIQLALRCDKLRSIFLNNKNINQRFVTILDDLIKYQLGNIVKNLRTFDRKNRSLHRKLIADTTLTPLKSYITLKKYYYIKYPFLNL